MWPTKREYDWYQAMGDWWHCIEDLRKFEKRYKSKRSREKHRDEWIRLCQRCVHAEAKVK